MAVLKIRDAEGSEVERLPAPKLAMGERGTARLKARPATYDRKPAPDILHEDVSHLEADVPRAEVKKRQRGRPKKGE